MPDPTPKASADEIREALAAATPGPWRLSKQTPVVVVIPSGGANGHDWQFDSGDRYGHERNAHLIANAPTWLAQLLAALEASERENERLRRALVEIAETPKELAGDGLFVSIAAAALAPSTEGPDDE